MTREEAIKILKAKINTMEDGAICCNYGNDKEVFDMAIKALEQEPCEDCVSRQAVMEYIKNCTIDLGYENGTNMVLDVISNMPSIQPKTDVLDKIRAELNSLHNGCGLFNDGVDATLKIIDKYRNGEQK